jgi:hypothetical protein
MVDLVRQSKCSTALSFPDIWVAGSPRPILGVLYLEILKCYC